MATPSTATAAHPAHQLYSAYPDYQQQGTQYRPHQSHQQQQPHQQQGLNRLAFNNNYNAPPATSDIHRPSTSHSVQSARYAQGVSSPMSSDMPPPRGRQRKADWNEFYKHGLPQEVIVIDDDTPQPGASGTSRQQENYPTDPGYPSRSQASTSSRHTEKRRRVDDTEGYGSSYREDGYPPPKKHSYESLSTSADTRDRTNSGAYSTAPTSLDSSVGSLRAPTDPDEQAGQKRKRSSRNYQETSEEIHETFAYYPPPRPPIKANDVAVRGIPDREKRNGIKYDDDDGHYNVLENTTFAGKYTIIKLLGQGTFGKVVEAYDNETKKKCAVKIIRAVPKYRDASRIELRVLTTLKQNDLYNRNKCIHLRDCFDYRNHICIVTDLLSSSVFDFLKDNSFTPFPSSHIQSFGRQLFTSVAFLHDLNLIHTDLKPENILLVNNAYQTFTYNRNIPSSSRATARTSKLRRVLLNPEIRLIDFGSATFEDEYHSSVVSTRHYRAPEIILNLGWSFPCDIWSIGCILVEFFTGDALFQTHDNLEHLAMMEAVCNYKIDRDIIDRVRFNQSRTAKNSAAPYFRPKAYALDYPNSDTHRNSKKFVKAMKKLNDIIPENNNFNRQFLDLLRRIFVYEPTKRITAQQALRHPWFQELLQDDGTEALKIRKANERKAYNHQQQARYAERE